jgi:hypothetical protein
MLWIDSLYKIAVVIYNHSKLSYSTNFQQACFATTVNYDRKSFISLEVDRTNQSLINEELMREDSNSNGSLFFPLLRLLQSFTASAVKIFTFVTLLCVVSYSVLMPINICLPYPTLPYPTLPYPTLPYPTLPYPTLPYPTLTTLVLKNKLKGRNEAIFTTLYFLCNLWMFPISYSICSW